VDSETSSLGQATLSNRLRLSAAVAKGSTCSCLCSRVARHSISALYLSYPLCTLSGRIPTWSLIWDRCEEHRDMLFWNVFGLIRLFLSTWCLPTRRLIQTIAVGVRASLAQTRASRACFLLTDSPARVHCRRLNRVRSFGHPSRYGLRRALSTPTNVQSLEKPSSVLLNFQLWIGKIEYMSEQLTENHVKHSLFRKDRMDERNFSTNWFCGKLRCEHHS
jgi:hypothetical protein